MTQPRSTAALAGYAGDPFAAVIAELRQIRELLQSGATGGAKPSRPDGNWSIADAAKHLGVSDRHLKNLIEAGKIRGLRLGRRLLISADEVARLTSEGLPN